MNEHDGDIGNYIEELSLRERTPALLNVLGHLLFGFAFLRIVISGYCAGSLKSSLYFLLSCCYNK